jgi:AcrR family transcriptional regulator
MASNRRIGHEQSKTRAQLLDAAEALMIEEGYAAVSSRRVAGRAGLKPQLVHYYFRGMDDLFLALFRRRTDEALERHAEALAGEAPLQAMWELSRDPEGTAIIIEFSALANHRKVIAAEITRYGDRLREMQVEALTRLLTAHGVDAARLPPVTLAVIIAAVSLFLRLEDGVGMSMGHAETDALLSDWIRRMEAGDFTLPALTPPPPPR